MTPIQPVHTVEVYRYGYMEKPLTQELYKEGVLLSEVYKSKEVSLYENDRISLYMEK